ncbi:MAG TPA: VOC family protein [Paenirhodobacter sp.]
MTTGIHHVTALTRDVQANVDFYAGFLGLRLVKRTAGFEDARQLHLFYGDAAGSPGSVVTFLVWQDGAPGRVGIGQIGEIALAVPQASIGEWLTRALSARVTVEGPSRESGETVLRLKDPDGIIVKLVGKDIAAVAPLPDPIAPTRIHSVTLLTDKPDAARTMLERFGYRAGPQAGAILRMLSDSDVIDLRDVAGFTPGIAGTGTFDHVALRAADVAQVQAVAVALPDDIGDTNLHDRKYFTSLYVRDAAEILFEFASDGPGFTVDEPVPHLGEILFTPPTSTEDDTALRVVLPQFALPGAERWPHRQLLFTHRLYTPDPTDDRVLILLHGSAGDETSLLPFGHEVAPSARLIGLRGRATDEGTLRWFRRFGFQDFDQADIVDEAAAFAAFLPDLARLYDFDLSRAVFIGHSNGANFLAAMMRHHPGLVRRAILLRAQEVLRDPPAPAGQAEGAQILMLDGKLDLFVGTAAQALAADLTADGAQLQGVTINASHDLTPADRAAARDWLAALA